MNLIDDVSITDTGILADSPITTDGTITNIATVPSYATDVLAGAGGLASGDLYSILGSSPLQLAQKI